MKTKTHPFGHAFRLLPGAQHWTMRPRWQCALLWPVIVCEEFALGLQCGFSWWEAVPLALMSSSRGLVKASLNEVAGEIPYEYAKR